MLLLGLGLWLVAADAQQDEADDALALAELVARLLVEAQLAVHPLDVVVRLLTLTDRLSRERLRLGELLPVQPREHLRQLRHAPIRLVVLQPRPAPPRHLPALLRLPHLVDLLAEPPQHPKFRLVAEHHLQVRPLLFAQALRPLDDQITPLEDERRLLLGGRPFARPSLPGTFLAPAGLALAPAPAFALAGPPDTPDGVEDFVGHVLQDVEDAQLVRR